MHLLACLLLAAIATGCASFGEAPTDLEVAGLHWYRVDSPPVHSYQWIWLRGPDGRAQFAAACGWELARSGSSACARSRGGAGIIYSLYSMEQAAQMQEPGGDTLWQHELRHFGFGMPRPGRWTHRETVAIREAQ